MSGSGVKDEFPEKLQQLVNSFTAAHTAFDTMFKKGGDATSGPGLYGVGFWTGNLASGFWDSWGNFITNTNTNFTTLYEILDNARTIGVNLMETDGKDSSVIPAVTAPDAIAGAGNNPSGDTFASESSETNALLLQSYITETVDPALDSLTTAGTDAANALSGQSKVEWDEHWTDQVQPTFKSMTTTFTSASREIDKAIKSIAIAGGGFAPS